MIIDGLNHITEAELRSRASLRLDEYILLALAGSTDLPKAKLINGDVFHPDTPVTATKIDRLRTVGLAWELARRAALFGRETPSGGSLEDLGDIVLLEEYEAPEGFITLGAFQLERALSDSQIASMAWRRALPPACAPHGWLIFPKLFADEWDATKVITWPDIRETDMPGDSDEDE